jgi:UDPglucose 6-dehydrogenase
MLKIGIIGYGFVGKAAHKSFEHNSVAVVVDPKYTSNTIADVSDTSVVFVCLPAPTLDNGSVDALLIYDVFIQLSVLKYSGIVVLKSTLPPVTTQDLFDSFCVKPDGKDALRYIYSPEFLRESSWEEDAIKPGRIIMAGDFHTCKSVETYYKYHSHVPQDTEFFICDYKEASLAKYAINTFLASKVVFMNQLHQLYVDVNGSAQPECWAAFTELLLGDPRIGNSHMKVPGHDGNYGYGGTCFPKDMKALAGFDVNGRMTVVKEAEEANTHLRLNKPLA